LVETAEPGIDSGIAIRRKMGMPENRVIPVELEEEG
jgi:hypothetical protein